MGKTNMKFKVYKAQTAEMLAEQMNKMIPTVDNFELHRIEFDAKIRVWVAIVLVWEVQDVQ